MEGFGVTVSTVFVGWGHRLWETVISGRMFRGEHRYSSHADAVAGHERECKWRREFRARVRQARPDLDFDDMA